MKISKKEKLFNLLQNLDRVHYGKTRSILVIGKYTNIYTYDIKMSR